MEVETQDHLIAASNILFGVANFVILPLPKAWRFGREISPSEVDSTTQRGDSLWVTSGRASHVVLNDDKRVGLELIVSISKGKRGGFKPKFNQVRDQGLIRLGGHEAHYALGEVEWGFFRKKIVQSLQLSFYCEQTNRTVAIKLTGKCPMDDLHQILEAMSPLMCH